MAYRFYKEKLAKAQSMGFHSIDAAVVHLYATYKSSEVVGRFFNMTGPAILYQLKKLGVPIERPGGYRPKRENK